MKNRLLQLIAGTLTAFVVTVCIYYFLQKDGGLFSGIIVAICTGLGIAFGQKSSA